MSPAGTLEEASVDKNPELLPFIRASYGLAGIVYTDIATDGMMAGPNVEAMGEKQRSVDVPVVASGGVTTVDDVRRLAEAGMAGCIIGRALYEGTIDLKEALQVAGQ